jgi:hypothetical protein
VSFLYTSTLCRLLPFLSPRPELLPPLLISGASVSFLGLPPIHFT